MCCVRLDYLQLKQMKRDDRMGATGDRFEGAYNKIDALLRKKIGGAKTLSFSGVVVEAARKDATVRSIKTIYWNMEN
jgi:hypothetical protein